MFGTGRRKRRYFQLKTDMDSKKEMEEKNFDYEPGFLYDFDEEAFKEYIVPAIFSMLTSLLVGFGISHITSDIGWVQRILDILLLTIWMTAGIPAIYLLAGTACMISRYTAKLICRFRRWKHRKKTNNPKQNK